MNLIQDRSCIWTSLEEEKDSNLKISKQTFSDAVKWMEWVESLEIAPKVGLKS